MKQTILIVLLLALAASFVYAGEINLSQMISDTYPLAGKCPPINGRSAYALPSQTEATVYFKHCGGYVSGYLVAGESVYAVPCGPDDPNGRWYSITADVRCGNPATGKFFLPKPPIPTPLVIEVTKVVTQEVEKEVVRTERCINLNLCIPPFPERHFLSPGTETTIWSPAAIIPEGTVTMSLETLLTGYASVSVRHQPKPSPYCPPGPPPPPPPPPNGPYCPPPGGGGEGNIPPPPPP